MISSPQKKKMPSEKAQVQEGWRSSSRGSKTNPNFQLVNKSSWIGPQKALQFSLIYTVSYLLVKNKKRGEGGMGVNRDGGFHPLKRTACLREAALIEDLRCCYYCFFFCLSDVKNERH